MKAFFFLNRISISLGSDLDLQVGDGDVFCDKVLGLDAFGSDF